MRKSFFVALGFVAAATFLLAQDHPNMTEKTVKADVTFSSDVQVGQTTLKAGEYRITCDRETITFTNSDSRKAFKFPCKGKSLAAPADQTQTSIRNESDGRKTVTTLLLKGSNVEHVFD